jgi:hypothetical protein
MTVSSPTYLCRSSAEIRAAAIDSSCQARPFLCVMEGSGVSISTGTPEPKIYRQRPRNLGRSPEWIAACPGTTGLVGAGAGVQVPASIEEADPPTWECSPNQAGNRIEDAGEFGLHWSGPFARTAFSGKDAPHRPRVSIVVWYCRS